MEFSGFDVIEKALKALWDTLINQYNISEMAII